MHGVNEWMDHLVFQPTLEHGAQAHPLWSISWCLRGPPMAFRFPVMLLLVLCSCEDLRDCPVPCPAPRRLSNLPLLCLKPALWSWASSLTSPHHLSHSFCEIEPCRQLYLRWDRFFYRPRQALLKKGHGKVNIFQNGPEIQAPAPLHPRLHPHSWHGTLWTELLQRIKGPVFTALLPLPSPRSLQGEPTWPDSFRACLLFREGLAPPSGAGRDVSSAQRRSVLRPCFPPPPTAQQLAFRGIKWQPDSREPSWWDQVCGVICSDREASGPGSPAGTS